MTQDLKLTAEQVSLILKRAAELDASGPAITADELIAIASEAGLDPVATRAAIHEITASTPAPVAEPPKPVLNVPSLKHTSMRAAFGGFVGILGASAAGAALALPSVAVTVLATLFDWMHGRFRKPRLNALFDGFVTWLGFFVGAGAVNNRISPDLMILATLLFLVTSAIGLILPRGKGNSESTTPTQKQLP